MMSGVTCMLFLKDGTFIDSIDGERTVVHLLAPGDTYLHTDDVTYKILERNLMSMFGPLQVVVHPVHEQKVNEVSSAITIQNTVEN